MDLEKEFYKPRAEMYVFEKGSGEVFKYSPKHVISIENKGEVFVLTTDNFRIMLQKIAQLEKRIIELEQK